MKYHQVSMRRPADPLTLLRYLATELPRPQTIYEHAGTWSFAAGVFGEVLLDRHHVVQVLCGRRNSARLSRRPLADVARALAQFPLPDWTAHGWVAFEYAYLRAGLPVPEGILLQLIVPEVHVRINSNLCVIRTVDPDLAPRLHNRLGDLSDRAGSPPPPQPRPRPVAVEAVDPLSYQQIVTAAIREIRRGDLQKVILSRRVPVAFGVDLMATYQLGRAANSPSRSFVLDTAHMRAVGFSPETVLTARPDGLVQANPLAGTRALVGDEHDTDRAATLRTDPKEVFEHAIAVKLAFDEVDGVCIPWSARIDQFMNVTNHGSVQHLGSRVSGRLPPQLDCWDAFEAVFPAVTASGVPKAAAFDCITRLETQPRGLYAGAVLTVDHEGSLDAAVALRTLFEHHDVAWLQAGAGIVATSDPAREYEETCEKLRTIAPHVVPQRPKDPATPPAPRQDTAATGSPDLRTPP